MLERDLILSELTQSYKTYVRLIYLVFSVIYLPLIVTGLLIKNKVLVIAGVFFLVWMIERIKEAKTLFYSVLVDRLTEHGMTAVSILYFMKPKLGRKNFFKFKNYCLIRRGLNEEKRNKQCDSSVEQDTIPKE